MTEHASSKDPAADDEHAVVCRTVAELPDAERVPLVLRFRDGPTLAAAAMAMGCAESTVDARVRRGLDLLRGRRAQRGFAGAVALLREILAGTVPAVPSRPGFQAVPRSPSVEASAVAGRDAGTATARLAAAVIALAIVGSVLMTQPWAGGSSPVPVVGRTIGVAEGGRKPAAAAGRGRSTAGTRKHNHGGQLPATASGHPSALAWSTLRSCFTGAAG